MNVRIGHASRPEGSGVNGEAGDQTGKEVCIREWYSKQWDFMAIHPDAAVREKHARACEAGCKNDHIGYSQFGKCNRNTLNALAKKANYDLSKITSNCNTDCSAFQNVCAVASGAPGVAYGQNGWTTSTMKSALKNAGYIILTDKKYLQSADYCVRGTIYVKMGSHTVCGLDNGLKAAETYKAAGMTSDNGKSEKTQTSIKIDPAKSMDKTLSGKYKITAKGYLSLRAGAGTEKAELAKMQTNESVECFGYYTTVSGIKWLFVTYKGQKGFASSKYLKK